MFLFAPKAKVSDGQILKHIINLQICAQTSEEAERELKPKRFYFDTSLCHVTSPGMGFLLEENSVAILRMEEEERHGGLSLQNPPQRSSPSPPEAPVTVMSAQRLRGGGGRSSQHPIRPASRFTLPCTAAREIALWNDSAHD